MLRQFFVEDGGQDLVEYALLVAFVAFTVLTAWLAIEDGVAAGYTWWDTQDQNLGSCTPGPDGSGC